MADEPFVDTHIHFFDKAYDRLQWAWLEPGFTFRKWAFDEAIDSPRYCPPEFRAEAAGSGLAGAVHVHCADPLPDPVVETTWIDSLAAATGWPQAQVGRCDLDAPDAAATIVAESASPLFRGIRDPFSAKRLDADVAAPAMDALAEVGAQRQRPVAEKDSAAGLDENHDLLGVPFVAGVRVAVLVQRQVGARDDPEGRDLGREVVEVIENADEDWAALLETEDLVPVGLAIRMQTYTRVAGLGDDVDAGHDDDVVTEELAQEVDGPGVTGELGQGSAEAVEVVSEALALAVVRCRGLERGRLGFQIFDLFLREQVRDDQVALELEHPGLLADGEFRPVAILDTRVGLGDAHLSLLLSTALTSLPFPRGTRSQTAALVQFPPAAIRPQSGSGGRTSCTSRATSWA